MKYYRDAFTLVEVVISLCIFSILAISFLQVMNVSIQIYQKGQTQYHMTQEEEDVLNTITDIISTSKEEMLNTDFLLQLCEDYKDEEGKYMVTIESIKFDGLYCVKIHHYNSGNKNLCTLVKSL